MINSENQRSLKARSNTTLFVKGCMGNPTAAADESCRQPVCEHTATSFALLSAARFLMDAQTCPAALHAASEADEI